MHESINMQHNGLGMNQSTTKQNAGKMQGIITQLIGTHEFLFLSDCNENLSEKCFLCCIKTLIYQNYIMLINVKVCVSTVETSSIAFNFSKKSVSGANVPSSHAPNESADKEMMTCLFIVIYFRELETDARQRENK